MYDFLDKTKPNYCEIFIDKYLQIASEDGQKVDLNSREVFEKTEKVLKNEMGIELKRKQIKKPAANFIKDTFENSKKLN